MKNVTFYGAPSIKIGQTDDDFEILYHEFKIKCIELARDHPTWYNQYRQPSLEEYRERLDDLQKVDMYLTDFRENKLEREMYRLLDRYKPCVDYAYNLLQDLLPCDIKAKEDAYIDKQKKKASSWRSRRIDMKNVLKTYTTYRWAVVDAIKEINFKNIKYD